MIPKYRIHENVIQIIGGRPKDHSKDIVRIGKLSEILYFLRSFGEKLTKIYFSGFFYNGAECHRITEYIAKYCGDNVNELELLEAGGYLFNDTTTPIFTKLEKLKVRDDRNLYENPQIHRIFPALKELSLELGRNYITVEADAYIRDLLALSPQLESFKTPGIPTLQFFQSIERILPDLTSLAVSYAPNRLDHLENQTVHFNHINRLSLKLVFFNFGSPIPPCPFTFDRLDTLEIVAGSVELAPMSIFEQNTAVKSLSFPVLRQIDGLLSLLSKIQESHNIEMLSLQWDRFMGADNTQRLLNEFDGLNEMVFIVVEAVERSANVDALVPLIPEQWNVDIAHKDSVDAGRKFHVSLVRKDL